MQKHQRKLTCEITISLEDYECLCKLAEFDMEPSLSEWFRAAFERYSELLYLTSNGETSSYGFKEPDIIFKSNCRRYVLYLDPIDIRNFEEICGLLNIPSKGSLSKVCRMMIRDSYAELGGFM